MNDIFKLHGQLALVTGASSGLGEHFAKTLSQEGAKVFIGARRMERLESLANKLNISEKCVFPIGLDVTDAESVKKVIQYINENHGPISILINNAGIPSSGRAIEMQEEEWERVIDTNLKGAWLMAREVGSQMIHCLLYTSDAADE